MKPLTGINIDEFIEETRISEIGLDDAFQKQSSLRAYYGALAARYEAVASKAKMLFEVKEATLFKQYRDKFAEDGVKTTEKMIENAVKMDPQWLEAKQTYINAECHADIAKSLVASLVDRKDMLIQIGADRRDENKGALRMMEVQQQNDQLNALRERAKQVYSGANYQS